MQLYRYNDEKAAYELFISCVKGKRCTWNEELIGQIDSDGHGKPAKRARISTLPLIASD
jgi:hypothetical protein